MPRPKKMKFQRFGRSHHLVIETAEDLENICRLDEAHWVATGAPINTLNCDATFLQLVDTDGNGRIMCFELLRAIEWLGEVLSDRNGVTGGRSTLRLDAINTETDVGRRVGKAAQSVLERLGAPEANEITLEQARRVKANLQQSPVSESGVVLPSAGKDEPTRQFLADILASVGGSPHPSGAAGVGSAQLDKFLAEAKAPPAQPAEGQQPSAVQQLGAEKLRRYIEGPYAESVASLIAGAGETAAALNEVRLIEKAILYQAHLLNLANNFVSFPNLYDPERRAMFDAGTLVMDGRRFNFAVKAGDRAQHSPIAATSNMFVLYIEIEPKAGGDKQTLAVPVTSGSKGNLCVGKRGLFQAVDGREYDAKVVQVIDNPISITEAFVSPFKRLGRLITGKIESLTSEAQKKLDATATAAPPAAPQSRQPSGLMAGGLLIGGGVAIAALGSAAAYMTKTLAGLKWYTIVAGIAAAVLAVILPTSAVAFIKLRRRDLSAILEGSGWAINVPMRLKRKQAKYFTQRPRLPRRFVAMKWLVALAVLAALGAGAAWFYFTR